MEDNSKIYNGNVNIPDSNILRDVYRAFNSDHVIDGFEYDGSNLSTGLAFVGGDPINFTGNFAIEKELNKILVIYSYAKYPAGNLNNVERGIKFVDEVTNGLNEFDGMWYSELPIYSVNSDGVITDLRDYVMLSTSINGKFTEVDNTFAKKSGTTFDGTVKFNSPVEFNGAVKDGNVIYGRTNIGSETAAIDFLDFEYNNGNTLFKCFRNGSSTQNGRYTAMGTMNMGEESYEAQLRYYHDDVNRVSHLVNAVGHQLAYKSDVTREAIIQYQFQISSEKIAIDTLEATKTEENARVVTKEALAREQLVKNIENQIIQTINDLENSIIIDDSLVKNIQIDIWELDPLKRVKEIVNADIWGKYEKNN